MARYKEPWEYWDDYCEEEANAEKYLPVCDRCGEIIRDDYFYEIGDEYVCSDCLDDFLASTERYAEMRREEEFFHGE